MGPYFGNVNFFSTNFFANYQPMAKPAAMSTGYMQFSLSGNDSFMQSSPLANSFGPIVRTGYNPKHIPYDSKTGFQPNFNSTSNMKDHMQEILLSNPKLATSTTINFKEVMHTLCSNQDSIKEQHDCSALAKTLSTKYGFKDKEIQKLFILGSISSVNNLYNKLDKMNADPESEITQRLEGIGNIKNSMIQQYKRIDQSPA